MTPLQWLEALARTFGAVLVIFALACLIVRIVERRVRG